MSFLNRKGPAVRPGDTHIPAGAINLLRDGMPRQLRGGRNIVVEQLGDRTVVRDAGGQYVLADHGHYSAPFVVRGETDDMLLCAPFRQPADPTTGWWVPQGYDAGLEAGGQVYAYVAKPTMLQKSVWNGKTVAVDGHSLTVAFDGVTVGQRTVTDADGVVQTQRIAAPYVTGDVIWARSAVTGLTAPTGGPVVWIDENDSCRQWVTTGFTFPSGVPSSVIGGYYAGPVNMNTVLSLIDASSSSSGTTAKYETWWRQSHEAASLYSPDYYLAGGGGNYGGPFTATITQKRLYTLPLFWPRTSTLVKIGFNLATASPGNHVRMALYSNLGQPYPNALVYQHEFSTDAPGLLTHTVSMSLDGTGLYWLTLMSEADIVVGVRDPADPYPIFGIYGTASHNAVGWTATAPDYAEFASGYGGNVLLGSEDTLSTALPIPLMVYTQSGGSW